jgi:hypothetical protein
MPKLNLSKIRRQNERDLKQYERIGLRIFSKALVDQAKENFNPEIMTNAYVRFYQDVFVRSARKEYNRIRRQEGRKDFVVDEFFLNTWRAWIAEWVRTNLATLITRVNENTRSQIQQVLAQAVSDGLNPFQTERLLRDQVGINRRRALAIARTESTRANSIGKERSAEDWSLQTGEELMKMWIHGGAREPRLSHLGANETIVRKSDFFPIDGGLYLPGDRNAPASSTVNCSCTVVFMSSGFVRRNYPEQARRLGVV